MEERVKYAMVPMADSSRFDTAASKYYPLACCRSGDLSRRCLERDISSCLVATHFLLLLQIFIAGFDGD
jgi:hypothetical protein